MYLAYKYIRDNRRKAKAAQETQAASLSSPQPQTLPSEDGPQTPHHGTDSSSTPGPQPTSKPSSSAKWKLLLMAALVVPVFFETLDYTGEHYVVGFRELSHSMPPPSCRHCTSAHCCASFPASCQNMALIFYVKSVFSRLDLQSYIGTVYLLTSTVFLPLFASLADIWGRHWALQLSLLLFGVGSAISTGAQSMITMLAGRGVAGIGAGGMMAVRKFSISALGSGLIKMCA